MARYELLAFHYQPGQSYQEYEAVRLKEVPLSHLYEIDRFTTGFLDKYALLLYLKERNAISEKCNALVIRHNKANSQKSSFYMVAYNSSILQACTEGIQSKKFKLKNEEGEYVYKYCAMINTSLPVYQKFCSRLEETYQTQVRKKALDFEEEAAMLCMHNEMMYNLPRYKYFRGHILESQNRIQKEKAPTMSNEVPSYTIYVSPSSYTSTDLVEDEGMAYLTEQEKEWMVNGDATAEYRYKR